MSPPPAIRSLAEEQRAALPPRLRAKLEAEPDEGTPGSNKALRLFAGAGVVAALAIVTILLMRFGPWVKHPPGPDAVVPNEPPTATSALHPEHESTSPTPGTGVTEMHGSAPSAPVKAPVIAGPTPSATRSATPSRPVVRAPAPTRTVSTSSSPTTSTSAPTAAGAVPSRTALVAPATKAGPPRAAYGVAVATFLFEDRATTEREKLAAGTGLTARIVTAREDGTDVYRLVLGSYPDRATAERGASDLVRRGLVDEARVVSLPKAAPAKP